MEILKRIAKVEYIASVSLVIFILSSCIPQEKIEYLYDDEKQPAEFQNQVPEIPRIKAGDELHIRVSSFDESAYNFFGTQAEGRSLNYPNELSISLISYSVNDSGYIQFPVLGRVNLEGKTIEEASENIKELLSEYFQQPNVIVSFVLKKIAILGEVRNPGNYTFTNARISIFQALGMAGDITIFGNKRTILIIRENRDKTTKHYLDLTKNDIFKSDYYYLEPDDIVYVAPSRSRQWSTSAIPYDLVLTSISTLILLLSFVNNY